MTQVNINVHQVTRVEGHGNIVLNARDGKIEELRWEVPESPRLFEVMLRGRYYVDVPVIASRICGICSISHTTASIQATEAAFGISPSEQTILLRKLLFNAEMLESHILHILFLAAPDFLGVGSVFPLVETHKDVVLMALRLKKLAYNLAELLAGRKTHPISCMVGGFAKLPDLGELKAIKARLEQALADLEATVELFKTLSIPDFTRETEYIALKDPKEYAFISGQIASTDAGIAPLDKYLEVTNEFCVPHSTAKYTKNKRDSYMVGALARFNNNYNQLLPRAKSAAKELGLSAPCHNPFMITVAQLVECVHAVEDSISLIDQILTRGLKEENNGVKVRAGRGIGAVEAPRGILFHDYTYDK
ncbi:MAG: nickel-dependent hydrogenase large subunit, partial [Dehalococcoidia bacterium]|nr:nickel-dependent hydrogenase large subunit [Dehalococcoidia bacterium]